MELGKESSPVGVELSVDQSQAGSGAMWGKKPVHDQNQTGTGDRWRPETVRETFVMIKQI